MMTSHSARTDERQTDTPRLWCAYASSLDSTAQSAEFIGAEYRFIVLSVICNNHVLEEEEW
jgi:hypothetical protein